MKEKLFLGGFWIMVLGMLTGCSSYYYSVLSSTDPAGERNERRDFIQETDTVRIAYSFNGEDAPVTISIYNKLNEPLFVDWTRSALIIDDVATSYYDAKAVVEGETSTSSYSTAYPWGCRSGDTYTSGRGSFAGNISVPAGVSFLPPKTKVEKTPLRLADFPFDKIPKDAYRKQRFGRANGGEVTMRVKEFTEADSPLYFRSYLTLYTDPATGAGVAKTLAFERSFYVSKLFKTGNVPPSTFSSDQQQAGDFFYVHNVKGTQAGIIAGAIAIGVAGVAIEATLGPVDY